MTANANPPAGPHRTSSRRSAVGGGALLAALATMSLRLGAAAQATPGVATTGTVLLIQSFSQGNLFPTQGDEGVLPYTAILWDAANRGFFFFDPASGAAGVIPTESILSTISSGDAARYAVLLALPGSRSEDTGPGTFIWALRLGLGQLGSDPQSVTYQGEPLPEDEATAWLGAAPLDLPESSQQIGAGYLILTSDAGFDASGQIHLDLTTMTR